MSQRNQMRMSEQEVRQLLERGRKAYVTTNGHDGWPHVVPLSYDLLEGDVAFWTDGESRKVRNLRVDDRVTCLVEEGDRLDQFRAVQLLGRAQIIDDYQSSADFGRSLFTRYSDGELDPAAEAYAAVLAHQRVIVRVKAEKVVSWDHRKVMVDLGAIGS
ncbi:MAG TPA: pyridoxamine 5'-phosphate oxidase family protein [Acidimicrobiales bacterium]|nr:pyridoxamine 5'-phosphate oxidase family protein [Acidimicrobiales bacterium]